MRTLFAECQCHVEQEANDWLEQIQTKSEPEARKGLWSYTPSGRRPYKFCFSSAGEQGLDNVVFRKIVEKLGKHCIKASNSAYHCPPSCGYGCDCREEYVIQWRLQNPPYVVVSWKTD